MEIDAQTSKRSLRWFVDEELVLERTIRRDVTVLRPPADQDGEFGAVRVSFAWHGQARLVSWFEASPGMSASAAANVNRRGLDFDPEPGSVAARRIERQRAHPHRYAARHVLLAASKVLVPLLLAGLVVVIPWPSIPGPDIGLPSVSLPNIPWPSIDLPSIPWPDWSVPAWLVPVLDALPYVVPLLIGLALARAEVRRRRAQEARKAEIAAERRATPANPHRSSGRPDA